MQTLMDPVCSLQGTSRCCPVSYVDVSEEPLHCKKLIPGMSYGSVLKASLTHSGKVHKGCLARWRGGP